MAGLKVSRRLAERAEVVIGLGHTFTAPDSGRTVSAGLDEPLQAPLTLMRASGHVEVLKLALGDLRLEFDSAR